MREIIKMGNPALREVSIPVDACQICEPEIQELIEEMKFRMREFEGVGIAAPQLGVLRRIFLIEINNNLRYPNQENFPLLIAINPELTILNDSKIYEWEGCLSIPGLRGKVERYSSIKLNYQDSDGVSQSRNLSGFPAIVAQHENDHLNGILFIEKMKDIKTLSFYDEYKLYWQKDNNII